MVTGSGTANQVAFWSTSSAIAGDTQLTYNSGTDTLALVGSLTVTVGTVSLTGGAASTLATTAGDLTLDAQAASLILDGGEAAVDAVRIVASNAAGGIDIDAGSAGIDILTSGVLTATPTLGFDINSGANSTIDVDGDLTTTISEGGSFIVSAATNVSLTAFSAALLTAPAWTININTHSLTWPTALGSAGQVLTNSGAGAMTWSAPASASFVDIATTAFEPLAINDLVGWVDDVGTPRVQKVDSNVTSRQGPVGFTLAAAAANGDAVTVRIAGVAAVAVGRFDVPAPAVTDVGKRVFMSVSAGQITLTAPTASGDVVQRVGILVDGSGSPKVLVQVGEPITL
jgi:hypothetical protein